MFIFNLFSVGFSSLCHSVAFVLCTFFLLWNRKLYVSTTERFIQTGKMKLNQILFKIWERIYYALKKGVSSFMKKGVGSVYEKITKKWQ